MGSGAGEAFRRRLKHQFKSQFLPVHVLSDQNPGSLVEEVFNAVTESTDLNPPDIESARWSRYPGRAPDIDGDRNRVVPRSRFEDIDPPRSFFLEGKGGDEDVERLVVEERIGRDRAVDVNRSIGAHEFSPRYISLNGETVSHAAVPETRGRGSLTRFIEEG